MTKFNSLFPSTASNFVTQRKALEGFLASLVQWDEEEIYLPGQGVFYAPEGEFWLAVCLEETEGGEIPGSDEDKWFAFNLASLLGPGGTPINPSDDETMLEGSSNTEYLNPANLTALINAIKAAVYSLIEPRLIWLGSFEDVATVEAMEVDEAADFPDKKTYLAIESQIPSPFYVLHRSGKAANSITIDHVVHLEAAGTGMSDAYWERVGGSGEGNGDLDGGFPGDTYLVDQVFNGGTP